MYYGLAVLEYAKNNGFVCDHEWHKQSKKFYFQKQKDFCDSPEMITFCSLCGEIIEAKK